MVGYFNPVIQQRIKMVNEDSVTRALDNAMAKVMLDEIKKILNPMASNEKIDAVCNALKELDALAMGSHPNYRDPMTALLYTSWYQPKQINLVYSLINQLLSLRQNKNIILGDNKCLNVTDFGCGALATQFAVAFAVADALDRGEHISIVRVYSYDNCKPMIDLGKRIWRRFQIEVDKNPNLHSLSEAMTKIKPKASTAKTILIRGSYAGDNWLCAIHAVYSNNVQPVKNQLAEIANDKNLDVGIITSFERKKQLINAVYPFKNNKKGKTSDDSPEFAFHLPFSETTSLRRELKNHLHKIALEENIAIITDSKGRDITWFLDTYVDWQFRNTACLTYIKR